MGKSAAVAPNSGDMLAMVARSASARPARPSPANSTKAPTTPWARNISVTTSTRSVAADPVAQHAQPVDHRRVRVRPHQRVGVRDGLSGRIRAGHHHRGEVLEVDLVDDARPGWHDAQVGEGGLRPAQELVALAVALVLAGHVEGEGVAGPIAVDLDGVVDDE